MGLFGTYYCPICHKEARLFCRTKMTDYYLCDYCRKLLSPFWAFTSIPSETSKRGRKATVQEVMTHLQYRAENHKALENFHPTLSMPSFGVSIRIDEANGTFVLASEEELKSGNPDLLQLAGVEKVSADIKEVFDCDAEGDGDGYSYYFYLRFSYSGSPWFHAMGYQLGGRINTGYAVTEKTIEKARQTGKIRKELNQYLKRKELLEQIESTLRRLAEQAKKKQQEAQPQEAPQPASPPAQEAQPTPPEEPRLRGTLVSAQPPVKPEQPTAPAPERRRSSLIWRCACGAENDDRFCTDCGRERPENELVFRCDKCGWSPWDPTRPPRFCPLCGDPFTDDDIVS